MKSTVRSRIIRQIQKPQEKDLVQKKKEEIKHFYLACGNYRETARAFQLQYSTVHKTCKAAPHEKVKVIKVLQEEKSGKEMLKVQDVHYRTQLL